MPTKQLTGLSEVARFHAMIEGHPSLRVVKVESATHTVYFHHLENGVTWKLPDIIAQLTEHGADRILAVLESREKPKAISHISRIVGYYSRVDSWNKSKKAELRHRQQGNYALPEPG